MIRINKKNVTKKHSKLRGFSLILAVVFVLSQATIIKDVSAASKIYVDEKAGNNNNTGVNPKKAVKTITKAKELIDEDGKIYVKKDKEWILVEVEEVDEDSKDLKEVTPTPTEEPEAIITPEVTEEPGVTEEPEMTEIPKATEIPKVTDEPKTTVTPAVTEEPSEIEEPSVIDVPETTGEVKGTEEPEVTDEPIINDNNEEMPEEQEETLTDVSGELPTPDDGIEQELPELDASEPVCELPLTTASSEVVIEGLTKFFEHSTFMPEEPTDISNIVKATLAYETLPEESKSQLADISYKSLRAAQIVVGTSNKVSNGIRVDGDLPWYVEFRAVRVNGRGNFELGSSIGSYELMLWNTLTNEPYLLNDQAVTVTIPVDNATKYTDISVIHYLPDGSHEILTPTRIDGENAISFVTTSFSPFELVGNTQEAYDQADKTIAENDGTKSRETNDKSNNGNTSTRSAGANTGDDTNMLVMMGIGGGAIAVIIALVVTRKKDDDDTEDEE